MDALEQRGVDSAQSKLACYEICIPATENDTNRGRHPN
mgnify:FL=1